MSEKKSTDELLAEALGNTAKPEPEVVVQTTSEIQETQKIVEVPIEAPKEPEKVEEQPAPIVTPKKEKTEAKSKKKTYGKFA